MSSLGQFGTGLAWASRFQNQIKHSLVTLAQYLDTTDRLERCAAVRVESLFASEHSAHKLVRLAIRYGLGQADPARAADLGHSLLAYALVWAYNPSDNSVLRQ